MNPLFLSYNSIDRSSDVAVQKLLEARGITTFLARDQLGPGSSLAPGAGGREAPIHPATASTEFAKPFRVSVKIAKAVLCYGCAAWLACVG